MKKSLVLFTLVLALVFISTSAFAQTYVVGTNASFPPFEYVEEGEIVGFDIDLIKAIAEDQGFEIEIRDLSFDSLPTALVTGSIDIIASGMTITKERLERFNFTDPYYSANQSVLVQEETEKNLTVLFGDNDIGVQTGTTGDLWVRDNLIETDILTGELRNYDSYVYVIRDLANGNIEAAVLDKPVAETFSKNNPVKLVTEIITGEEYGFAVANENEELLQMLNEGLDNARENGTMDELIEKYF